VAEGKGGEYGVESVQIDLPKTALIDRNLASFFIGAVR
jgi:hypothetical protein